MLVPLVGFTITPVYMLMVLFGLLSAVLGAVLLVKLGFKKDDEQEDRLRGYGEVASWLKEVKLPHAAELFACLNVKDLTGASKELLFLLRTLRDPRQRAALLDENFAYQITSKVCDETWWPRILQAVQDRQAAIRAAAGRNLQALTKTVETVVEEVEEVPVATKTSTKKA